MKKSELKIIIKKILLDEGVIQPDAYFVKKILNSIKSKLIGKKLGNLEIEEILNKAFEPHMIEFTFGGNEDPDDPEMAQVNIGHASTLADSGYIEIYYTNNFYQVFENTDEWSRFVDVIYKTISHELIHRIQLDKISQNVPSYDFYSIVSKLAKADPNKLRTYLGKPHELMAFAKEAYLEFSEAGYSNKKIIDRIRKPMSTDFYPNRNESHIFWTYTEWFDMNEEPMRRFLKYMYLYATQIEI
jgi:hypothetical protein